MKFKSFRVLLLALAFSCLSFLSCGQNKKYKKYMVSDSPSSEEVVRSVMSIIEDFYYDSEKGQLINAALEKAIDSKEFENAEGAYLSQLITKKIHSVEHDRHIQLIHQGGKTFGSVNTKPISDFSYLSGNIGYIKMDQFPVSDADTKSFLASALQYLKNADGVIIDLRENGGGSPLFVDMFLSQFVTEDVVYDEFIEPKSGRTHTYKTDIEKYGNLLKGKPLRILTSEATGSSGELLAYAFQNLKLGKVYGKKTRGMVNLAEYVPLSRSYIMLVSKGHQKNPFNATGIEGIGVTPDEEVESDLMYNAHRSLLKEIFTDDEEFDWYRKGISVDYEISKTHLSEEELNLISGKYGLNEFEVLEGELIYNAPNGISYTLEPISSLEFRFKNAKDRIRYQFVLEEGVIKEVIKKGVNGNTQSFLKN